MATHAVFLPEKSHEQRRLAGYSHKESDITKQRRQQQLYIYIYIYIYKIINSVNI